MPPAGEQHPLGVRERAFEGVEAFREVRRALLPADQHDRDLDRPVGVQPVAERVERDGLGELSADEPPVAGNGRRERARGTCRPPRDPDDLLEEHGERAAGVTGVVQAAGTPVHLAVGPAEQRVEHDRRLVQHRADECPRPGDERLQGDDRPGGVADQQRGPVQGVGHGEDVAHLGVDPGGPRDVGAVRPPVDAQHAVAGGEQAGHPAPAASVVEPGVQHDHGRSGPVVAARDAGCQVADRILGHSVTPSG
ncbi:hypothetical protein BJF78_01545 [Pseudonocardia sp. CNS-139]|nr:hypothetical protein BJF78_01545 [Pseudonocardia sp. CNS-139]